MTIRWSGHNKIFQSEDGSVKRRGTNTTLLVRDMKATTFLLISAVCISYGFADANWLHDIVKGVSDGIHDAYEKGKSETKDVKEKLEKKFDLHPKMKSLEKKGKFIDKFLKFIEKKKAKGGEIEDFNNLKYFTKIDDDGDEKNDVPFVPKDLLRKDSIFGEKGKKKAEYIFKHLAKMWKEKTKASTVGKHEENKESDDAHKVSPRILTVKSVPKSFNAGSEKEPDQNSKEDIKKFNVLGKDEKEIIPDFVVDDFKKQKKYFGKDAKKIIPDYVVNDFKIQQSSKNADKLKKLHKVDVLGEDEEKIMPDFVKREFQIMNRKEMEMLKKKKKKVFTGDEELAIQLLGETDKERAMQLIHKDQVKKDINKESEELEKTVEELIPFLGSKDKGQGKVKEEAKSEKKEEEEEVEVMGTKEKFMKEKDEQFKQSEKKILEEEKAFEEAEKKWEEEIRKKTLEEIKKAEEQKMKKTTQQEEIEEELHETADNTFTPPDEVATPTEPTISDEQVQPLFTFNFDEKKEKSVKKVPEEEKIFSVPRRIEEPASLFQRRKKPESAFEEMSDEVKPFFEKLDDAKYRKKFLEEEKQWMKIKKWALNRFFKNKNGRWRKNAEE